MKQMRKIFQEGFIALWIATLAWTGTVFPQSFGKNKVQYREFDWEFLQTRHFDIYYYDGGRLLAEFAADVAESSYVSLKQDLRYEIEKRIPILIYNSHNDFGQTNVTYSLIEESVGGFTEIFKDRVVIPFQGNYADFRHVIHHELTHAVMFQMLYGRAAGSMVMSMARFQVPLWLAEGLAEYESLGWDIESDMYIRDATINGYIPPIDQMYGYLVYKGGQSVLHYIAEKYGGPKIGEMLGKIRSNRNVEQGLKSSIGIGIEDLSERWQKDLRKTHWPDIQDRNEPEDISKQLTDHEKERSFLNNSPALSPKGDKMVFLSSRADFIDIYLMNIIDSKKVDRLVKGERSDLFEELHWLRPGMDWSPDGKKICFAAKGGDTDALYILDVNTREIEHIYNFELDGLFSPSWSPDGNQIVFMGMKGPQSDLYLFTFGDKEPVRLTDDIFSDMNPVWSPAGGEVAFISERGEFLRSPEEDYRIQTHDYDNLDLYTIDINTRRITRHTTDSSHEQSPAFSPDGSRIAFISDRSGVSNIYIFDRNTQEIYPITNLLTGVSQISWSRDGSRLVYSTFFKGGFDLYLINNPLEIKPDIVVKPTLFVQNMEKRKIKKVPGEDGTSLAMNQSMENLPEKKEVNFRNFVFGEDFKKGRMASGSGPRSTFLDTTEYKDTDGEYKTKKYKIRFSPDIISGGAGYSQFFGLQGTSMIMLSDILGNHQINIYTDLFYNIKNSNFQLAYFYLPRRTDLGVALFHYSYLYYTYYTDGYYLYYNYIRDRNYGMTLYLSRPFDRFRRVDFGLTALGIDRDYGEIDPYGYYYGYSSDYMKDLGNIFRRRVLFVNLGYSTDTVIWGMTGPVNGARSNFSFAYSPKISNEYGLDFWTFRGDWRKYFRISRDYTFVIRMAGGMSGGQQPQHFMLGGMAGWINYQFNEISSEYWSSDMFYFSTFETPLRGAVYYELIGTRFFLSNLEFRFPLIRYLILGWPLPIGFQDIRGAIFLDMGSAWDNDRAWKPFTGATLSMPRLNDLVAGYGIGLRMNLGFFLIKYDMAWRTDFASTSNNAVHYLTLGAEF